MESPARTIARKVRAGVSLYAFSLLAPRLVRLVTLPIVVRTVTPADYGAFATLWPLLVILHTACDLGIGTASVRLAPERSSPAARRTLFSTAVASRAVLSCALTALCTALAKPLARFLLGSDSYEGAVVFTVLGLPFVSVFDALADELRSREAHRTVALLMVVRTLCVNVVMVAFVLAGLGLRGLVLSRTATEAVLLVVALVVCLPFVRARPSLAELRRILAFGVPFGLLYFLATVREVDRVVIRALSSVEHVAGYDLAMRVVAPVSLSNVALALVLEPHVYRHADSADTPRFVGEFLRAYSAAFSTVAMIVACLAPEIFRILAPASYEEGIVASAPLVFAYVCDGVLRVAGIGADLAKKTRVWVFGSVTTVVVSLPLTALLVPRVGITGAGVALLAGVATATVVTSRLSRRVSALRPPVALALVVPLVGAALGGAALQVGLPLPARLALLAVYSWGAFRACRTRLLALAGLANFAEDSSGSAPAGGTS
ncbi:MAG TPA: lipopolysaccharide biosynthesis protein [Polyangiaceae bacterium]|nr:lipopolysaccharide biosynthesis protein [Polyangiaceae bacterium]